MEGTEVQMKGSKRTFALFLSIMLVSCSGPISILTLTANSPQIGMTPTAASEGVFTIRLTPTIVPSITPMVIEPVVSDSENINITTTIVQMFSIKQECIHSLFIDNPELRTRVKFLDLTSSDAANPRWISAIADSLNGQHRASIVCIADHPDSIGCYDHVHVEDQLSSNVFEIQFYSHLPWRPLYNLFWIGNDILVFTENSSPNIDMIYAVDIEKREYAFLSIYYSLCE